MNVLCNTMPNNWPIMSIGKTIDNQTNRATTTTIQRRRIIRKRHSSIESLSHSTNRKVSSSSSSTLHQPYSSSQLSRRFIGPMSCYLAIFAQLFIMFWSSNHIVECTFMSTSTANFHHQYHPSGHRHWSTRSVALLSHSFSSMFALTNGAITTLANSNSQSSSTKQQMQQQPQQHHHHHHHNRNQHQYHQSHQQQQQNPHHNLKVTNAPEFAEEMLNLTVPMGRDVTFECVVNNLGSYKIAWLKMDNDDTPVSEAEIISIQTQIVLNNSNSYQSQRELRYRVSHNNHRQWFLHIKQIKSSDRGYYVCQINTEPTISQSAFLDILIAPSIDYNATSADISVDERHRLSIRCRAKGYPSPTIVWRREDNKEINLGLYGGKRYSANKVEGEFLNITQVTRDDMGAYLCIASNSVPPSVSKRIIVRVNFRPKIKVSNQLVGSIIGSDVQLECRCEASPTPATSWIRHDGQVLAPSNKYQLREEHDSYKTKMKLKIMSLDEKDFGSYKCVAKNTIGEKEGLVRLYEIAPPASTPSGGDPMWPTYIYSYQGRKNGFNRSNQNQNDDNKNYDYSDYQQAASTSTAALYRCNDNLMLLTLSFIITILITYIRC